MTYLRYDRITERTSVRNLTWESVLYSAVALLRLPPRVPAAERRSLGIQIRRAIPRRAVEALADMVERDPESRDRAAAVLRWVGLDAAELFLDRLRQGEAIGIGGFFYDVIGGMPDSYPMVLALLRSHQSHETRHAAALLGRLGQPDAVRSWSRSCHTGTSGSALPPSGRSAKSIEAPRLCRRSSPPRRWTARRVTLNQR